MAKIIAREWTSKGPTGRRVGRTSYGYQLMANGQRERRFSSEWRTEADALGALLARQKDIEAGVTPPEDITLKALTARYIAYKVAHGKRSARDDRRILETRLLPALGAGLPVRKLTTAMVAAYEETRLRVKVGRGEGARTISTYTVANELAVLRHMLRLAHRKWGYLDRVPDIEVPRKPEGRRRYLDEPEIARLLAACAESRKRSPNLHPVVTLAINTGMRKGEILGLEWERVDLSSARITLYETKNGLPRGVPINRAVYEALIALEPKADGRSGLVFRRRDGAAWGQIRTAFATALRRAGIQGFRFHDLRHTAASHMVMRGATLKDVQEVLGHRDFKMTLRYSHLSPAHLRAAVDRLDGLTPAAQETPQGTVERVEQLQPAVDKTPRSASV